MIDVILNMTIAAVCLTLVGILVTFWVCVVFAALAVWREGR